MNPWTQSSGGLVPTLWLAQTEVVMNADDQRDPSSTPDASEADPFEADLAGFPVSSEEDDARSRIPLEVLATEFIEQHRQGLRPRIADYKAQHPHLADEIDDFFPMVIAMERWKSDHEMNVLREHLPTEFPFDRLGNCRLIRELGRGGMGVVFDARRDEDNQRVAVKLLPWKFQHVPRWRQRFEKEARLVSKLRHRHIVSVYSFGEHEGYCYYVMQLVEGVALDWIINRLQKSKGIVYAREIAAVHDVEKDAAESATRSGRSADRRTRQPRGLRGDSWRGFAKIGLQVSQALEYAHRRGTLHNDIKPANLLLDQSGHVWVTDFGVAREIDQSGTTEANDRLMGTLRFMAPERFRGQSDGRSDVYSLGSTLYELVTRSPAFSARNNGEMIQQVLKHEVPPPQEVEPRLPDTLAAIIMMAMAPEPSDRYESAAALASDLSHFLSGKPTVAQRSVDRKWWRRLFGG